MIVEAAMASKTGIGDMMGMSMHVFEVIRESIGMVLDKVRKG